MPVSGTEWRTIFKYFNEIITPALRELKRRYPEEIESLPRGINAVKWTVASIVLPRLKGFAKSTVGIPSKEEVARKIAEILATVTPEQVEEVYRAKAKSTKALMGTEHLAGTVARMVMELKNLLGVPAYVYA